MAQRGSKKAAAQAHENHIAVLYEGEVSPSSGAAVHDAGDVRTEEHLFECKMTGAPGSPAKSSLVTKMEKIADEAWGEGRRPVLCLRFFMPESVLANGQGYVDLTVRLTQDDAYHADKTRYLQVNQKPS